MDSVLSLLSAGPGRPTSPLIRMAFAEIARSRPRETSKKYCHVQYLQHVYVVLKLSSTHQAHNGTRTLRSLVAWYSAASASATAHFLSLLHLHLSYHLTMIHSKHRPTGIIPIPFVVVASDSTCYGDQTHGLPHLAKLEEDGCAAHGRRDIVGWPQTGRSLNV